MSKCCLKLSNLRRDSNGGVGLYSVVLAGGPNHVRLIIISLLSTETAFVPRLHEELHRVPAGRLLIELIESD